MILKNKKNILIAGFAIFSMFFGSGNLIFPLAIGVESSDAYFSASIGLLLTGILVPMLGFFSVALCNESLNDYFAPLGKTISFVVIFAMLALLGPFGVCPRCIQVAFGGIQRIFPGIPLSIFSALFCIVVYLMTAKHENMIEVLGQWLSPLLLTGIILLIAFGINQHAMPTTMEVSTESFIYGIKTGYQMMDLLAAFFFSYSAAQFLKARLGQDSDSSRKFIIQAGLIGLGLLALVYIGFIIIGAKNAELLATVSLEQRLVVLSNALFGHYSSLMVAIIVGLACLTTMCALSVLFADFLQKEIMANKISANQAKMITLTITYLISLFGFGKVAAWIEACLTFCYPALIAFAAAKLLQNNPIMQLKKSTFSFWCVLSMTCLAKAL